MASNSVGEGINETARVCFARALSRSAELHLEHHHMQCGAQVLDFGVSARGGLQAGLELARICMAGRAEVSLVAGSRDVWAGPWVQVATDTPLEACMLAQYAGWPVKAGSFFAMGSGAMRVRRGKEELLLKLGASDSHEMAVGTLECDTLPDELTLQAMAVECKVPPQGLRLAVAPTRSIAGCVQVVARSVETSLHKLYELGFPLTAVCSAHGVAPLPPATPNFALGIGRTNDAILYGGHVTLWVDADDGEVTRVGPQLPSSASRDYGAPFAEVFARYDHDFYKVDPGLFSPAEVMVINVRSGNSWKYGGLREDLIASSFATELN
jgi:methenyltetrahydromethanopterin cyclohydrolase